MSWASASTPIWSVSEEKTMEYNYVRVDIDKCTGCRVCEYACSMEKDGAFNPTRSRIRVVRSYPHTNAAITCRLCEDMPCVNACPRKALSRSEKNGSIRVDEEICDGCGWCVRSCKVGAMALDPKPTVRVCDLCSQREAGPACIEWCPEEALGLAPQERGEKGKGGER